MLDKMVHYMKNVLLFFKYQAEDLLDFMLGNGTEEGSQFGCYQFSKFCFRKGAISENLCELFVFLSFLKEITD